MYNTCMIFKDVSIFTRFTHAPRSSLPFPMLSRYHPACKAGRIQSTLLLWYSHDVVYGLFKNFIRTLIKLRFAVFCPEFGCKRLHF